MNAWVLMVVMSWTSPAMMTQRFPNQVSCESARNWVRTHSEAFKVESVCLPDIREEPEDEKYELRRTTEPVAQ